VSGWRLDDICRDYIAHHRARAERELRFYAVQRTDEDAISKAAVAELPSGKRHPHQYRVPRAALEESRQRLVGNARRLGECTTFRDLHELVAQVIVPIPGVGELTIYDTALRIGARFGLTPDVVYLHAGTRNGANALGVRATETLELHDLPEPLQTLTAREVEDVLCIYKDRLAGL
jgi:hypothetical protein